MDDVLAWALLPLGMVMLELLAFERPALKLLPFETLAFETLAFETPALELLFEPMLARRMELLPSIGRIAYEGSKRPAIVKATNMTQWHKQKIGLESIITAG